MGAQLSTFDDLEWKLRGAGLLYKYSEANYEYLKTRSVILIVQHSKS